MPPRVSFGNAAADGAQFRQWFVGDLSAWSGGGAEGFGPRDTRQLSMKWGVHPAGEERPGGWAAGDELSTLSVLVSGRFWLQFGDATEVRLERPGDYALWEPGVRHVWTAMEDSVVFTVRWKEPR